MAKTISDDKLRRATAIIDKTAEPRIRVIVDELNKFFAKDGIHVGAEVKWFFDEAGLPEPKPEAVEDDDDEK